MTKATKKPQAVIDAEAVAAALTAELAVARATVERLETERREAYAAITRAQTEADSTLPQCRMVRVGWRSGKEDGGAAFVIVRQTPGGILVVRRAGEQNGSEWRFKWVERAEKYRQAERASFTSDTLELRDVPPAYMPVAKEST